MTGVKQDYKDPLSLQPIRNPYTSRICKHTYEKDGIITYIQKNGTQFASTQTRGQRDSELQVQCVHLGCDKVCPILESTLDLANWF